MQHKGTVVLQTERLLLRPFKQEDLQDMHTHWMCDPDVAKYNTTYAHETLEETQVELDYILLRRNDPNAYIWAIEYQGSVVGSINVSLLIESTKACALGYSLGKAFWGRGLMTEACKEVIRFLFEEVQCNRVFAFCDSANIGSIKVMQKSGLLYEGTLRAHLLRKDGTLGDKVHYGLLQADYLTH